MRRNIRYQPSKAGAIMGVVVGILFILIGIFEVIPIFGFFGIVWTLFAVGITIVNVGQALGKKNFMPEIRVEDEDGSHDADKFTRREASFRPDAADHMHITGASLSPKERLEQLEVLKGAGLIDDGEYQDMRTEILKGL